MESQSHPSWNKGKLVGQKAPLKLRDILLTGPLNVLQIVLGCALGLEPGTLGTRWRSSHPKLASWYNALSRRSSFAATRPPPVQQRDDW